MPPSYADQASAAEQIYHSALGMVNNGQWQAAQVELSRGLDTVSVEACENANALTVRTRLQCQVGLLAIRASLAEPTMLDQVNRLRTATAALGEYLEAVDDWLNIDDLRRQGPPGSKTLYTKDERLKINGAAGETESALGRAVVVFALLAGQTGDNEILENHVREAQIYFINAENRLQASPDPAGRLRNALAAIRLEAIHGTQDTVNGWRTVIDTALLAMAGQHTPETAAVRREALLVLQSANSAEAAEASIRANP